MSSQTNPEEPISLKRENLTGRCEVPVNEQLIVQHEYEKKKRVNKSPEARENRLKRQRRYTRKIRANESPELREKRLANQCKYQKKKIANESAECREKRLRHQREYQKEKTRNESLECREKKMAKRRECAKKKKITNTTVADEVRKFRAAVSEGPMYICSVVISYGTNTVLLLLRN